jgi:membrane protease YdiL (CAAX protease family)
VRVTDQVAGRHEAGPSYRIAPSPLIGCLAVIVDIIVVFGLQLSSGIPYAEWTSTPDHTLRAAIIPLAVGSVLLVAFLAYSRWDIVWRDPARLPLTTTMKVAMAFFVLAIVVRLLGVGWGSTGIALLLAVLATGVLVGFAEEILFRGIFLRSMRTGGRTEAYAALWTAIAFGLFHLPNVFVGIGGLQLTQVAIAAISGVTLYLFRRSRGTIVVAMIAHGIWDISTFLTGSHGAPWINLANLVLVPVGLIVGIVALVSVWRTDRNTVVTPNGIEQTHH